MAYYYDGVCCQRCLEAWRTILLRDALTTTITNGKVR